MGSSGVVRTVLLGLVIGVAAGFAACAQGNQFGTGGGGVGGSVTGPGSVTGSGGADAGPTGMIGSACTDTCAEGTCTVIGNGKYCTQACPPACPDGTYCSIIGGNPICVPDLGQECGKCTASTDCKLPSDSCLTAPAGDSFCARDCTVDGVCGNGFVCTGAASYADGGVGTDGGAGGGSAGSGSGGASGSGGGAPLPSAPNRWCVPDDGLSCPCSPGRDGVTNACAVTNSFGTCTGMETCNGASSTWMGCSAMTPAMEICNGKDDNCNGQIDEGDPNMLCSFEGAQPPNANWACANGMCQLGTCDAGWTAYPPGPASAGCACQVDANEPNGSCAAAKSVGSVTSTGGTPLVISGTLSSDTDVDYYAFTTTDVNETTTNSYHVAISFTAPAANTEFVFDVTRGTPCVDAPTGAAASITTYDWCVNGTDGTNGEAPCGPTATNHCTDYSSQYYLRVHRAAGVTATCTQYQITVTGGGGTCDLTQKCP